MGGKELVSEQATRCRPVEHSAPPPAPLVQARSEGTSHHSADFPCLDAMVLMMTMATGMVAGVTLCPADLCYIL